jgi:spore maturation protein CgeB
MKILAVSFYYYYGSPKGLEPQFYYLFKVPQKMGHEVDFFDYVTAAKIGIEHMRRLFLKILKGGNYDAVFLATHQDEFDFETLAQARKFSKIIAWNSDDEWRWDSYSRNYASHFDFMVTNSPGIYQRHRSAFPNLLHAQWACTGFWDGRKTEKNIDFSFVGQIYGLRNKQVQELAERVGLQYFGRGSGKVPRKLESSRNLRTMAKNVIRHALARINNGQVDDTISFEEVNALWNRSKISFTPLDSSTQEVRQIKSRVFDMGLSGTLMLAHHAPFLDSYYEPGKEFVPFETIEECVEKAKYYLQHERERQQIAEAYARRTQAEHLWEHRIQKVLAGAGLS